MHLNEPAMETGGTDDGYHAVRAAAWMEVGARTLQSTVSTHRKVLGPCSDLVPILRMTMMIKLGKRLRLHHMCITPEQQRRHVSTLILLRHGQSEWNGIQRRFTGWVDVPLTVQGRVQAVAAGQLLRARGYKASRVDVAFTSELQRAYETCELALASMAGPEQHTWNAKRIRRDWRLNERHYGAVQGLAKNDPLLLREYGPTVVREWRRSMKARPPPLDETHEYWQPPPAPLTESLEDCQVRVLDCFHTSIAAALFEEDLPTPPDERAVVVVAHSNTIRALMADIDKVPIDLVPKLHVPNSVPILYHFDTSTRLPLSSKLQSAAGGSHARWLISAHNHHAVRNAIQPGGMLTRALFDALDADGDQTLTAVEIEHGLRELLKDEGGGDNLDCVVMAVAKKIARDLSPNESISLADFEKRATEAYQGLEDPEEEEVVVEEP